MENKKILVAQNIATENATNLASILPILEQALQQCMLKHNVRAEECLGLAIGFPGIVNTYTGQILSTLKKYEDAIHLDLASWSRAALDLPLRMENDARLALLGEQYAGAAQGAQN
ncbi:MAG: ROK family protein, partial [Burkholderiales bacterium]